MKQKYPEGTIINGVIKNIASFGIFVGIEDGIDGLVHISDISWKHRVKHPSEFFQKGQEIEVIVLNVDVEKEKFSLGIKQIENDPWEELSLKYTPGSVVTGKVTNITDFGVFVEIEEGIEGLVHVSELSQKKIKLSLELFAVGDIVSAVVKSMDVKNRKIRLSIKDCESSSEGNSNNNRYLNNTENVGYNLREALADIKISNTEG
jgi:small subunit ribosomal protein S1